MPDRMPEDMSDRMPEDLPVRKFIHVMVGFIRSEVFFVFFSGFVFVFQSGFVAFGGFRGFGIPCFSELCLLGSLVSF